MFKKIKLLFIVLFFINGKYCIAQSTKIDLNKEYTAYNWSPISDVEKVLQYENEKDLTKRMIDQSKLADAHYISAVSLMKNEEYTPAINEFKNAIKRYKRAKLSDDAFNFIRTNMALCYANTNNKEDLAVAKRLLEMLTSKTFNDNKWTYNVAMAHFLVGNKNEAASLLSSIIRKDPSNFQTYVTLASIYKDSGNLKDHDKVMSKMANIKKKLKDKQDALKYIKNKKDKTISKTSIYVGKKPDVKNLKIVKKDDPLQFDKIDKIDERSMNQIQEGIGEYELGIKALSKKDYSLAQTYLKNTEKKLKRGKISDDGLNFCRGNLAIAYLATENRRNIGQAKRYLQYLTKKLYKTKEWTYNMAVAHYAFASNSKGAIKDEYLKEAVKLFNQSIKQDKLFLPAYQNLIYVYREIDEDKKADNIQKSYEKNKDALMRSFSKENQLAQGGEPYIFRLNLGTFGEYDTPADIFDEDHLISVPISENKTAYLSGMFYSFDEAVDYQKQIKSNGYYPNSFIVGFKDGERLTF